MDSPTFEHDPIKVYHFFFLNLSMIYYIIQKYVQVYDQGRLEENWDGTEDDDDDNEFHLNEKYFFKTTKLSDNKTSEDDDGKQYIYSGMEIKFWAVLIFKYYILHYLFILFYISLSRLPVCVLMSIYCITKLEPPRR